MKSHLSPVLAFSMQGQRRFPISEVCLRWNAAGLDSKQAPQQPDEDFRDAAFGPLGFAK